VERLILMTLVTLAASTTGAWPVIGQELPGQPPVFSGGVELVRVTAIVRDRRGRFVPDLSAADFEILDAGAPTPIVAFESGATPLSVAILFDISGSMEAHLQPAREAAMHLLTRLDPVADESAVFTFDTALDEVLPFAGGRRTLPERLSALTPFGATSLHDAIARAAEQLANRPGRRPAVVVFTDGRDNASRLTAAEVSGIASAIDVPVYIVGIVPPIDNPFADGGSITASESALDGELADLAAWTGGRLVVASTPAARHRAALQIVEELRQQYLIAFESSGQPGWHPLEVRVRGRALVVRARSGYFSGRESPHVQ
jgi:VWFA-related protein